MPEGMPSGRPRQERPPSADVQSRWSSVSNSWPDASRTGVPNGNRGVAGARAQGAYVRPPSALDEAQCPSPAPPGVRTVMKSSRLPLRACSCGLCPSHREVRRADGQLGQRRVAPGVAAVAGGHQRRPRVGQRAGQDHAAQTVDEDGLAELGAGPESGVGQRSPGESGVVRAPEDDRAGQRRGGRVQPPARLRVQEGRTAGGVVQHEPERMATHRRLPCPPCAAGVRGDVEGRSGSRVHGERVLAIQEGGEGQPGAAQAPGPSTIGRRVGVAGPAGRGHRHHAVLLVSERGEQQLPGAGRCRAGRRVGRTGAAPRCATATTPTATIATPTSATARHARADGPATRTDYRGWGGSAGCPGTLLDQGDGLL